MKEKDPAAVALGKRRFAKMSKEEISAFNSKAAKAGWKKLRAKKKKR